MFDISVTRWQNGMTNARDTETLSDLPLPNRMRLSELSDDFHQFNELVWSGLGFLPQPADKGIIQGTGFLKNLQPTFRMNKGFRMWADFLFGINALTGHLRVGLVDGPATISNTVTDGIYMRTAGTANIDVVLSVNSQLLVQTGAARLVDPAGYEHPITFQLYWDGGLYASAPNGRIVWEISGPGIVTPARGSFGGSSAYPFPDGFPRSTMLTPGIGSTAAMQIDMLAVYKDRFNILMNPTF